MSFRRISGGAWALLGVVLGVALAAALLMHRHPALISVLAPVDLFTARLTAAVIDWCGIGVLRSGVTLSHPEGFSYYIYYRCTGLLPAAFLVLGILVFPSHRHVKLAGMALGVPLIFLVNLIRLTSLFYIGVRYPDAFSLFHSVIWEGFIVIFVAGFLLGWTHWASPKITGPYWDTKAALVADKASKISERE